MLKVNYETLNTIFSKNLYHYYLIIGNDSLLIQESKIYIIEKLKFYDYECFNIILDSNTNWDSLFFLCKTYNFFTNRKLLILDIIETNIKKSINQKLTELLSLSDDNLFIIIQIHRFNQLIIKSFWFKIINDKSIIINCLTPKKENLINWLNKRAKTMGLSLNKDICKLLCTYYNDNLSELVQILKKILLICENKILTIKHIKYIIHNFISFKPLDWINALLNKNYKLALYILYIQKLKKIEPLFLLNIIQRELILIIKLNKLNNNSFFLFFKRNQIYQNHQKLLYKALQNFTLKKINISLNLIININKNIKSDKNYLAWLDLKILTLFLCNKIKNVEFLFY